jgi:hypothetical protein
MIARNHNSRRSHLGIALIQMREMLHRKRAEIFASPATCAKHQSNFDSRIGHFLAYCDIGKFAA